MLMKMIMLNLRKCGRQEQPLLYEPVGLARFSTVGIKNIHGLDPVN